MRPACSAAGNDARVSEAGSPVSEAGDHGRQLGRLHRLGHVHLEAGAQRLHPVLRAGVGGESHRRYERTCSGDRILTLRMNS
jgi:hypothetical protein